MAARGTLESLGCCATNGSAAVPAAAAIAAALLNVSGSVNDEELASLLQGAEGQLPGPLTSLGDVDAGRGAPVRCEPFAPFAVQLTHSAPVQPVQPPIVQPAPLPATNSSAIPRASASPLHRSG